MALTDEVAANAAKVSTQSYSMSVGELMSMHRDQEIDLHPEFQRFFRWSPEQKSRLIESLLLGIPIPPVFVSERGDSRWDVIDGLQRLSTILELVGELKDEEGKTLAPLVLTRTRYLPGLDGLTWTGRADSDADNGLPDEARIKIKRARIDVNIVKSTSDDLAKYELFQRLNTGGSVVTDQEVRNCLLLMVDRSFYTWVKALGETETFRKCVPLTERALEEAYDLELVVRFVVLVSLDQEKLSSIAELGSFLTDSSIELAKNKDFDRDKMQTTFRGVFDFLEKNLAEDSFRRFGDVGGRYLGPMLISLFEVVAVGLGHRVFRDAALPSDTDFKAAHKKLWQNQSLTSHVGSGISASRRIPHTVSFGATWLAQ